MAMFCSCGAELPDNARFCHRCGKPQRDEDLKSPEPPVAAFATGPAAGSAPAISFGNPVVVRVALLCAALCALLNNIPVVNFGCCLWWTGAGFLAAVLYSRRTGLALSVGDGGRLGAITGVFTFAIWIVFAALAFAIPREGLSLRELFRRQIENMPAKDEAARRALELMTSPAGLAVIVVVSLLLALLVTLALVTAGGALGAKVLEKD